MSALYEDGHRRLQAQFDTQRLADRIEQRLFRTRSPTTTSAFVERLDLFFLATVNASGEPSCSYKGGDPGFVRVLDPKTLVFPSYDGNGMYLSMGNIAANRNVGMLFIDLTSPKRLRVNGEARARAGRIRSPGVPRGAVRRGRERSARCSRTARATSTNSRSSSARSSCRTRIVKLRCPDGNKWTGHATCYRKEILQERSHEETDRLRFGFGASGSPRSWSPAGTGLYLYLRDSETVETNPVADRARGAERGRAGAAHRCRSFSRLRSATCRCRRSTRATPRCTAGLPSSSGPSAVDAAPVARAHHPQHRRHDRQRAAREDGAESAADQADGRASSSRRARTKRSCSRRRTTRATSRSSRS